jgi:DNA-binding PadR family transcriptional regulator
MPRKKRTQFTILGLLAAGPLSGYDIRRSVEETIGHFWSESYGQIYPELGRLTEEGLVTRSRAGGEGRPVRRIYALTPAGGERLRRWLQEPAEPQVRREELLLKLFLGAHASPGTSLLHIRRHREAQRRRLEILSRIEDRLRELQPEAPELAYWLATIRHGVLAAEAGLRWCDEAEELLPADR